MISEPISHDISNIQTKAGGCPVDHSSFSQQKTARSAEPQGRSIERDAAGVWHIRDYAAARAVLRSNHTKQAGFKADLLERVPGQMKPPVLYQEGQAHHQQRKQTARFFTPKAVSEHYRSLMVSLADQMVDELRQAGQADLTKLSMRLAVRVASEVVGLTNSRLPGMDRRLNAFFADDIADFGWSPRKLLSFVQSQARVLAFFYLDVKPAISARKRVAQEDVISHLIAQNYNDAEILTECITYGAAGMVTTREFISIATWHLLEQPSLRAQYLAATEEERHLLLQEILRLEPVVGHLYRRTTADLQIESNGVPVIIPQGALIDIHVYGTNADRAVVGEHPLMVCPARELHAERVGPAIMAFGDGHHRCPGAYIAIQETDIFLQRLLALDGLRLVRKPSVSWMDVVKGYELRDFVIAV